MKQNGCVKECLSSLCHIKHIGSGSFPQEPESGDMQGKQHDDGPCTYSLQKGPGIQLFVYDFSGVMQHKDTEHGKSCMDYDQHGCKKNQNPLNRRIIIKY